MSEIAVSGHSRPVLLAKALSDSLKEPGTGSQHVKTRNELLCPSNCDIGVARLHKIDCARLCLRTNKASGPDPSRRTPARQPHLLVRIPLPASPHLPFQPSSSFLFILLVQYLSCFKRSWTTFCCMAPAFQHPPGVSFIDDKHAPVTGDAATYYGGGEYFSRTRTYSNVS